MTYFFFFLLRKVEARFRKRSCILLSPTSQSSQFHFKNANTALQSRPLTSTALSISWSSKLLYFRCGALAFFGFALLLCPGLLEGDEVLVLVMVEELEVFGICILPPIAAFRKMLSSKSPMVEYARNPKMFPVYIGSANYFTRELGSF